MYQGNIIANKQNISNTAVTPITENKDILSPEQRNSLQHSFSDKLAEQTQQVKSNYQSAKDMDLTRAYYQQQQKLFDIYMQTSSDSDVYSSNSNKDTTSTISSLNDTYAALYDLHKNIKEGVQNLPEIGDGLLEGEQSSIQPLTVAANEPVSSTSKQTDTYNSLMMPSTRSYMHLSA